MADSPTEETLLLVDPDHDFLDWATKHLSARDLRILRCDNAQNAVKVVEKTQVDVVIAAISLEPFDGLELLTQIRDHPDFAKLVATEIFRRGRDWQESIGTIRRDAMGVFADAVRQVRPASEASLAGAALFGATLVAGLDWLVFQPERSLEEVRRAVIAAW